MYRSMNLSCLFYKRSSAGL